MIARLFGFLNSTLLFFLLDVMQTEAYALPNNTAILSMKTGESQGLCRGENHAML